MPGLIRIATRADVMCAVVMCSVMTACAKPAEPPAPVAPVQVAPAVRGTIHRILNADGVLYPRDQANITPKITAPVRRFLVNRGDPVKEGQLLAELENRDLVAAAQEGRGQYNQAQSNYRSTTGVSVPEQVLKAQSDVDAARQALDAAKKLLDSREQLLKEGAVPRKLVDEAQVAYAQARAQFDTAQQHLTALQEVGRAEQLNQAAAQVEAAKGRYEAVQAQVSYSEIRSPITGVVTDRPLYPGEMATTGAPLMTIMDLSAVVAHVNMAQDQAVTVKVGNDATLTPSDGGRAIPGKVSVVSPAADPNSTTVQVWVQADNHDGRLRAGQSVRVAIVAATIEGVTTIPVSAVLPKSDGGTMALVVDNQDTAHQRDIKVGVRELEQVQVLDGVQPGERVVTVGGLGLEDKTKVRIVQPGENAAPEGSKDGAAAKDGAK